MFESFGRINLNFYASPYAIRGYKSVLKLRIPAEINQDAIQLKLEKEYKVEGELKIEEADVRVIKEILENILFLEPGYVDAVSKLLLLNDRSFIEDVTRNCTNKEEAGEIIRQAIIAHELGHIKDMCLIDRATMSLQFILLKLVKLLKGEEDISDIKPEAYFLDPVAMEVAALLREHDFWKNKGSDCVKEQIDEKRRKCWPYSKAFEVCEVIENANKMDDAKKFIEDCFILRKGGFLYNLNINKRIYYIILAAKTNKSVYDMLKENKYEIININNKNSVIEPLPFFTCYSVVSVDKIENEEEISLNLYVPEQAKEEEIMKDLRDYLILSATITRIKKDEKNPFYHFISGGDSGLPRNGYIVQNGEVYKYNLKSFLNEFYKKLLSDKVKSVSDLGEVFKDIRKKKMKNENVAEFFNKVKEEVVEDYYKSPNTSIKITS